MIKEHLIPSEPPVVIETSLSRLLLKVIKQDQSSTILQFVITNIDKASEDFATICELKYLQVEIAHVD